MIRRNLTIGSEWLYYKIYTGPRTSDTILTEIVWPLVQQFQEKNWIDKWFFIRYADPDHHIRLRFLVSDRAFVGNVIEKCYEKLDSLLAEDIIWKLQLDTYSRELERYGESTMEISESLFWYDSEAVIQFLGMIEGDEGEELRWLYGIRVIDSFLSGFGYTLEEKYGVLNGLKTSFGKEFNMSRPLKKQLDAKYREKRNIIERFMSMSMLEASDYSPILSLIENAQLRSNTIVQAFLKIEAKGQLLIPKESIMGSYIHMLMNRLFKSKNRLNEMVCYDFLFRYYTSALARAKTKTKN